MLTLAGRHAFITGSTQGIGLEIAAALKTAGASVILHGLRRDNLAIEAVQRCGSEGDAVEGPPG